MYVTLNNFLSGYIIYLLLFLNLYDLNMIPLLNDIAPSS